MPQLLSVMMCFLLWLQPLLPHVLLLMPLLMLLSAGHGLCH
jgi:hypothetical protein